MNNKIFAIISGLLFFWGLIFFEPVVWAWSEPAGAPPTYNVAAPINIGNLSQIKSGGLGLMSVDPGTAFGLAVGSGSQGSIKTYNANNSANVELNKSTLGVYVNANKASYNGVEATVRGVNSVSGVFNNNELTGFGLKINSRGRGLYSIGDTYGVYSRSLATGLISIANETSVLSQLKNSENILLSQTTLNFVDNEDIVAVKAENFDPTSGSLKVKVELAKNGIGLNVFGVDQALNISGNSQFNGGVTVNGVLSVSAGCNGCGDLAESFVVSEKVEPADIVAIDKNFHLIKAEQKSKTTIGVISAKPTLDLNKIDGKPVALAGIVSVKVNAENGAIQAGDFIAVSKIPGVGMKACSAGTVVGKALEDFFGSFGQIKMIVSLSYFPGIVCQK